jgi:hypothetical protein
MLIKLKTLEFKIIKIIKIKVILYDKIAQIAQDYH